MKINRIVCFMLVLILSVSMFVMPTYADNTEKVSGIELLYELGIVKGYEDGELHPEYNITRMEYAALIIRCLGYDGEFPSLENVFSDVPKDSWGAAAVQFAYDLGIINGYGDGTFGPDDNILEIDAVKIIVSALGRSLEAEAGGGYPTGYLSIAQRLKLMKNYQGGETKATRGFVATLIANALEVPIVEQNFTSNAFMENDERTILSILGISKYKGVLNAISGVNLLSQDNVLADETVISNRKFKSAKSFDPALVGENVIGYVYNYGESDEKLIALFLSGDASKTITVQGDDISSSSDRTKFVYYDREKNKEKEVDLPSSASIVYNGTLLDNSAAKDKFWTNKLIKPSCGYVKIMDTDNNGAYENIFVKNYDTYVVKTVTEDSIYDIFGRNITFDLNEENSSIIVKKDGSIVGWEDIAAGDVLDIAGNLDRNINSNPDKFSFVAEIIISNEAVTGKVISTAERDGKSYYGIDSSGEHCITKEYADALRIGKREALDFELGEKLRFKLNSFGAIAYVDENVSEDSDETDTPIYRKDGHYGFITDAGLLGNGMENDLEVKILTKNNALEIFLIPNNKGLRFGRMENKKYVTSKATPEEIYEYLTAKSYDRSVTRQIVKYVLNEEGNIRELYLPDDEMNTPNLSKDTARVLNTFSYGTVENNKYFNEDTTVFVLEKEGRDDKTIICTSPGGYFGNRSSYNSELWDVDSDGFINCVVIYPTLAAYSEVAEEVFVIDALNDAVILVTNVGSVQNDEGVVYTVIEGYEDGMYVKRLLSDTLSARYDIRPGMIIQYKTNSVDFKYAYFSDYDEVIIGFQPMCDLGVANLKPFIKWNHKDKHAKTAKIMYGYTTVTSVNFPTLTFAANDMKFKLHNGTMVLKYNRNGYVEQIDMSEIVEGQKVFFRTRVDNLRDLIVIE